MNEYNVGILREPVLVEDPEKRIHGNYGEQRPAVRLTQGTVGIPNLKQASEKACTWRSQAADQRFRPRNMPKGFEGYSGVVKLPCIDLRDCPLVARAGR